MKQDFRAKNKRHTLPANWVVLKFGGSSVGDAKHWQTITQQILQTTNRGYRPFLVLSALKNVSNLLEALLHQALAGVHPIAIAHLKELHLSFSAQLGLDLASQLQPWFQQLQADCDAIYESKKISAKSHAKILAVGELLSTTIGSEYLKSKGLNCHWQDARQILKSIQADSEQIDTWHKYTNAQCCYEVENNFSGELGLTEELNQLAERNADVIVTQGFIASDLNADTVLLGREGSDTSAAYFGALLQAQEIQIWTDVPGVFSCNPQENAQARQLTHLSYQQAAKMAQFGAKVLHPRALQPAEECAIPIEVKSTRLPSEKGTRIDSKITTHPLIRAIVLESPIILVSIESTTDKTTDNNQNTDQLIYQQLLGLGYDLVMRQEQEFEQRRSISLIMRYNNSDKIEPNRNQLNRLIQDLDFTKDQSVLISDDLSIISVIGNSLAEKTDQEDWLQSVREFCSLQTELSICQSDSSISQGRVSLVVPNHESAQWGKILHRHFIESQNNEGFGPNWADFCKLPAKD